MRTGAPVVLLKNLPKHHLVNGDMGRVISYVTNTSVSVKFDDGRIRNITPEEETW